MKSIIFICKYNRFRSRFAEAYFNKINKNRKIKAISAGVIVGTHKRNEIEKDSVNYVTKKFNIKLKGKPSGLTTNLLKNQKFIIIVANDVPKILFDYEGYRNKLIVWNIPDEQEGNKENLDKICKTIIKKVNNLITKLDN